MKRYQTTPIYYVNDRPHIGHAYTTILADAVTRWHQMLGRETFFLTGTDEHGQKVQRAAEDRGVTPQEHCDEYHEAFKSLWPLLHIEHNRFIRTTDADHVQTVQKTMADLFERGLIYLKQYGGWYSVSEERFWTEKDLVDGKCPASGNAVEWIEERNYFFRMSQFQQQLIDHIRENPDFIRPEYRCNEVLGFLRQPLEDLCVSRPKSRLSWGIELPFDTEYVTYVWFDALLNYLTGIGYPDSPDWEGWWAESTHIIGKDILTTHCVYWTTMLMGMGVPLPRHLVAHGWWLMADSKMSKTKGNVVDPMALKDRYGVEVFRYYLLREMSVGQDASFSEEGLVRRNNTALANDLGNLLSRTLSIVEKRFEGKVPAYSKPGPEDAEILAARDALRDEVMERVEAFQTHRALEACMNVVRSLNRYVNSTAPFKVVKTDPERAGSILYVVLSALREAAWWLKPAMPTTMAELLRRIGAPPDGSELVAGAPVEKGTPLFPRFDLPSTGEEADAPAEAEPKKAKKAAAKEVPEGIVAFEDFAKLDLRVAQIISAEAVEGAKKLLKLSVDLGDSTRQVVAGIALSYEPDALVGKRVVLLANLAPRKIFGIESRGMLLAAQDGDNLFLIGPDGYASAGASVS